MIKSCETVLAGKKNIAREGGIPRQLRRKPWWKWIKFSLGFLISAVFLYLALRGVNLGQVRQQLQSARYAPIILAILIGVVSNIIRAIRWRVLLGSKAQAKLGFLFTSMMIGYLANNVLPARIGELVRIYVLNRKAGVSKSTSAATVVLERVTDALVLLAIVAVISFFLPLPDVIRSGSRIATIIFVMIALLILIMAFRGKKLAHLIRMTGFLPKGLNQKIKGILERFVDGLSILRSTKQAFFMLMLTFVIWGLEATLVALVIGSLNLTLPWIASLLLVVVLSLSFIIPAAPGAVGTYEFFAVVALTPFAVENSQAVGLAIGLHFIVYVTSSALGLFCLWAESLSLRELAIRVRTRKEEKT